MTEFYSSGGMNDTTGREPFEDSSRNLIGGQANQHRGFSPAPGVVAGAQSGNDYSNVEPNSGSGLMNDGNDDTGLTGRSAGGYATQRNVGDDGNFNSSSGNPNLSSGAAGTDRFSDTGVSNPNDTYGADIGDKVADNHRVGRHNNDFTGGFAATGGAYDNPYKTTGLTGRETTTTGVNDQNGNPTQKQGLMSKVKNAVGIQHNNADNANTGGHNDASNDGLSNLDVAAEQRDL